MDAWLDRIEPGCLLEWEAFDQLQPIGDQHMDQRFKALGAWLCTLLGSKAYQPDDIKGISPEIPARVDDVENAEQPLDDDPDDYEFCASSTSADVLRDYREQSLFR